MRNAPARNNNTLPIAITFIGIVIAIVILSFVINLFHTLSQSKFDGNHQFVLLIQNATQQAQLVDYSPETSSLSLILVKNVPSQTVIGQSLDVPIDVTMQGEAQSLDQVNLLLQRPLGNLAWVDAIKLWWFGHQVKPENISTSTIDLSSTSSQAALSNNFIDKTLYSENKTIAIINASGVTGKGNQLAKLLTNMGANVISVTGDREQDISTISYMDAPSYTGKRLQKILHYSLIQLPPRPSIATITIVIGKESSNSVIF